ncbi:expressed unknown protein [Seminavis robusta]|uniref:Uncharacterized protein n=1 Tax=Seminavis robusta TaxID=568900 RepID=A0A9N8DQP6_9STRA|nr:expressed unknown protein [Seminavis robusta]|eukprot:Sro218_g090040.1 n/a (612) ;mRNA; r:30970-32805
MVHSDANAVMAAHHNNLSETIPLLPPAALRTEPLNGNGSGNKSHEDQDDKHKEKVDIMDLDWIDRDAVYFGVRMTLCITIASFFILLRSPGDEFMPQAFWVVVTVLFVCWFPTSLDAASVVEKSLQRLYGTIIGAFSGISCGFLSLLILYKTHDTDQILYEDEQQDTSSQQHLNSRDNSNPVGQSAFLIACISIYTFVICWGALQFQVKGKKGGPKIIAKYNYACILSLLTFYISILPFYSESEPKWRKARWRVTNVIVGCFIGAGLSVSIFPRSTKTIIQHKIKLQLQWAGEAAEAVLHYAADSFSETAYVGSPPHVSRVQNHPHNLQKSIRERLSDKSRLWKQQDHTNNNTANTANNNENHAEVALAKYESAINQFRIIKTQLNNLTYDPFRFFSSSSSSSSSNNNSSSLELQHYRTHVNNILARALRIQNTVVLLDGIVRNDPKHNFSATHINQLARIGTLIRIMLTTTTTHHHDNDNDNVKNEAAFTELKAELVKVRKHILELASVVAHSPREMPAEDYGGQLDKGMIGRSNLDLTTMMMISSQDDDDNDEEQDVSMNDMGGRVAPKHVHGSRVCALLFLQLVEHLALRSIRLYQSWKQQCEEWQQE